MFSPSSSTREKPPKFVAFLYPIDIWRRHQTPLLSIEEWGIFQLLSHNIFVTQYLCHTIFVSHNCCHTIKVLTNSLRKKVQVTLYLCYTIFVSNNICVKHNICAITQFSIAKYTRDVWSRYYAMVGQLALSIGCSSFNLSPTFIHFHPQHCSAVTAWQSGSAHFAVHSFVKILLIALSQLKQAASWTLVSILWCDNCQQNCGEYLCNILCRNLCNIVEKISAAFCGENLCSTVEKIHVLAAGGIATWIGAASTFKRRFVCTFWAVFGKNPPKSATYFFLRKNHQKLVSDDIATGDACCNWCWW